MKKKFTFLMAALMLLATMVLPGKAVGQEKSYTYELVTSLSAGDEVVIVNTGLTKELTGVSSNLGTASDITGSAVSGISGTYLLTVEAGSESNSWSFKNGSNYLAYTKNTTSGDNYLSTVNAKQKNSSWTVSINDQGVATITNCNNTVRVLKYNSNSPRFCCYGSGQNLVKIYKRVEAKVATPTFSPAAGSYSSAQSVTISSTTGATIYYTTDGTTPTTNSSVYSSAINVSESMTIKAFATKSGLTDSDVATAEYNIVPSQKLYITSDHGTVAVTANDASVSITDSYYSIPQGANVTLSVTPASGYTHTGWTVTEGSVTITNNAFAMPSSTVRLTATYEEVVVDNLTAALVNAAASSKTYIDWSGIKINTAVYAGNSNINDPASNYIQLNSGSPKGIVTTTSGGYAKKVSVTFVNNTSSGRTITVYGKNTAYSGPSDLYSSDDDVKGTSLGTIVCGTNTEITITGDYLYIGLLANGALYVEPITITWLPLTFYDVNYTASYTNSSSVEIGTVEVSKETAVAGETITITATGKNHYHFNGWTVLDDNAEDVPLTGTNPATFTMPASDVDVEAAWEEDTKYTISVADGSEDYVLAPSNSYAAETVLVQITDVPDGKFIDEVTVAKNGGGNVDDVTYTGQEGDYYNYTFTMPADAVTISVTFKDPETYTVSYYVKGTLDKSEDYTEGNSVTLPTSTTTVDITGFTLLGWSETEGGTTTLPAGAYYPDGNVSLYAVLGVVSNTSLTITPNTANLPTTYGAANTYDIEGKEFVIKQVYVPSGNKKIQWRSADHASGAGTMYNNENFGRITSIVIAYYTGDDTGSGQTRNFLVKAGTSANPTSTSITGTTTGDVVTFDLSGGNYTYFVLAKGSGAGYLSYIIINYEESASVSTVTEYTANDASRSTNIEASECVIIKSTGVLTFTGLNKGNAANIIIEDGGQLITSNSVKATVKKETYESSAKATNKWYLISSPVNTPTVASVANGTYNMYYYDEPSIQWMNDKVGDDPANLTVQFSTLENGRGYLYRSTTPGIEFAGDVNIADATYRLSYTAGNGEYAGFNLIGNPFSYDIYKNREIPNTDLETNFYVLEANGGWTLCYDYGTSDPAGPTKIKPNSGILVQAQSGANDKNLVISKSSKGGDFKYGNDLISFRIENSEYSDIACVIFQEGHGLNKVEHRNAEIPMLYIMNNGERFASACMPDNTSVINLGFEAKTMGEYTISLKAEGQYNYMHLYDKLTGEDIDMLVEDSYTFIGSQNDRKDRFVLNLNYNAAGIDSESDIFAYQSGSDIIVSGEGELQVFDITGRKVMTTNINGVETINGMNTGVYILKLNGKAQKIVVR